jgi:hypothetical protein
LKTKEITIRIYKTLVQSMLITSTFENKNKGLQDNYIFGTYFRTDSFLIVSLPEKYLHLVKSLVVSASRMDLDPERTFPHCWSFGILTGFTAHPKFKIQELIQTLRTGQTKAHDDVSLISHEIGCF